MGKSAGSRLTQVLVDTAPFCKTLPPQKQFPVQPFVTSVRPSWHAPVVVFSRSSVRQQPR
jgi:hypothetical protein